MRYHEVSPSTDLARDIHCYWELDGGDDALDEPIFPDGRVEIVVHLGARPRLLGQVHAQPELVVVGQMTTALRLQPISGLHAIGIRFTPAGARTWLGAPVDECTNRIEGFDQINRHASAMIRDAVHRGGALQLTLPALESALRQSRQARWSASRAVDHAVQVGLACHGRVQVETLAASAGLGVRQLERQFLEAIGLSHKRVLTTARFQHALQVLRDGHPPAEVAEVCGFADQAHLAREFRTMAGAPARDISLPDVLFLPGR